jgi:hypothetical protein
VKNCFLALAFIQWSPVAYNAQHFINMNHLSLPPFI